MFRRAVSRAVAVVAAAVAILATLTVSPAAADDCDTPGCGGEVSNNSGRYSIVITNCWDNDAIWVWEGSYLDCHGYPPRVGNFDNAAVALQPGDWSSRHDGKYSEFYDTDAVRFPGGCVTVAHFWGRPRYTTDRRGLPHLWGRISSLDHFYIDSITC
ncbi:hypothetical protein SUDANB95_03229 [Actinosynnema sp. ALI-1.44]